MLIHTLMMRCCYYINNIHLLATTTWMAVMAVERTIRRFINSHAEHMKPSSTVVTLDPLYPVVCGPSAVHRVTCCLLPLAFMNNPLINVPPIEAAVLLPDDAWILSMSYRFWLHSYKDPTVKAVALLRWTERCISGPLTNFLYDISRSQIFWPKI